jgi:hypothetical protein
MVSAGANGASSLKQNKEAVTLNTGFYELNAKELARTIAGFLD